MSTYSSDPKMKYARASGSRSNWCGDLQTLQSGGIKGIFGRKAPLGLMTKAQETRRGLERMIPSTVERYKHLIDPYFCHVLQRKEKQLWNVNWVFWLCR